MNSGTGHIRNRYKQFNMIRKIIRKTISTLETEQHVSILSKEYVLENKTSKENVRLLIKKLHPYDIGKRLIRLGSKRDGGYLVPDDLEEIKACFSPGVSTVSDFELDCHKLGMQIFLADKSVDKPRIKLADNKYHFLKKHVGCFNNLDFITLETWVESSKIGNQNDLMLQMDIEGAEYITLINMSDSLMKLFRIIVIEFHNLHKIWNEEFYNIASIAFEKILQNHTCVHIHPNNFSQLNVHNGIEIPMVAEFTFIRNDRILKKSPQKSFPHPLDSDNSKERNHIKLPKNWYNA